MKRLTLALIAAAALVSFGHAGELTDAASTAESLMERGDYAKALSALNGARDAVWNASPLVINKAILVASDPQGFGIYDIREDNRYKSGEEIVLYTEPSGFAYGKEGEIYLISMALDFEIKSSSGETLASQENFAQWQLRSRVPNKEFMGKITYKFSGVEPGDYVVETRIRDLNSDETTSFSTKFTIVE
ncbi:MAG: hypothetical protein WCC66_12500 [Rhizobiaceae bacterium]